MALLCLNKLNQLPSRGKSVGDVYHVTADKSTWLVVSDFSLLNLSDFLSGSVPHTRAVGPQGERGDRGIDGVAGRDGKDARDGRDSDVPGPVGPAGPPGKSLVGPQGHVGAPGRDGKDGAQGPAGRDGKDSTVPGPQGPKGDRGDCLVPNESELAAAVIELRQQKARAQAAFLQGLNEAGSIQHAGARAMVIARLNEVKKDAGL
jgi:hypothetical protein